MAPWNRKKNSDEFVSPQVSEVDETGERKGYGLDPAAPPAENTELHRGLKARHITMIAIGGAIGTGLIIGTGKALAAAG
jgi:amino acid transporter